MTEIITQEKSRTWAEDKDECARLALHLGGEIESAILARRSWEHLFYGVTPTASQPGQPGFLKSFTVLFYITHIEEGIKQAKYGNILLIQAIEKWINNTPIKNVKVGIKLSRVYIDVLKTTGLLSYKAR